jgi:hypothetical protein
MFREHRGNLADSMATLMQLPDSFDALIDHMRKLAEPWPTMPPITRDTVRIEWRPSDFLVTLENYGVFGYIEHVPIDDNFPDDERKH